MLGTAGGWIERFNLQSGIGRGSYLDSFKRSSSAHDSEVVGIACDSTNTLMISAGYHGDIKVHISFSKLVIFRFAMNQCLEFNLNSDYLFVGHFLI